jgi:hypothetical protein
MRLWWDLGMGTGLRRYDTELVETLDPAATSVPTTSSRLGTVNG